MSVNEDFHHDSRPLVAGQITGVRSFAVDKLGRLTGVTHRKVWRPGVNEAHCPTAATAEEQVEEKAKEVDKAEREGGDAITYHHLSSSMTAAISRQIASAYSASPSFTWHVAEPMTRTDEHRPGAKGCGCGFWAYFDGSDDFSDDDNVTGIIRGEGVVTVGSKGFRAERAEVVALVDPSDRWAGEPAEDKRPNLWDRWSDWIYDKAYGSWDSLLVTLLVGFSVAAVVLGTYGLVGDAGMGVAWTAFGLSLLSLGGWAVRNRGFAHGRDRSQAAMRRAARAFSPGASLDPECWEAVRRNYPDVPVYPTLKAALRDFPLTEPPKPEPITPDNTPDFWEREA